jgi:hypothetical protein
MKAGFKRFSVLFAAVSVLAAFTAPPASAVAVGPLEVRIDVDTSSWDADGCVSDDLSGASYTVVLVTVGYENRNTLTNGTIIDYDVAYGNPACAHTEGGFDSDYAAVVYTLTWTSVLGTSGELTRVCVEALNTPICTPT